MDYDFQAIREEERKERADIKKNAYRRYLNKKSMQIKEQYEKLIKYYKAVIYVQTGMWIIHCYSYICGTEIPIMKIF